MGSKQSRGFTLIEVLIVITILGMLAVVLISSINPLTQMKKGRDDRRKRDMKRVQAGFEQFYSEYQSYNPSGTDCGPIWSDSASGLQGVEPTDPTQTGAESYHFWCGDAAGSEDYCICAHMELNGGNAQDANCWGTSWVNNGEWYCLTAMQ